MARRRKNRTHLKGSNPSTAPGNVPDGVPKSFIIKHGHVGASLTQLVRDVRRVMEPNTAARLKERARNKLKDYLTMAPALQVTHLLAFTLTDIAPSLRIVRIPAGPTLSFRIERYSLVRDVLAASRRAKSAGMEYLSPPLLVLASFPPPSPTTPPHLPLLQKTFQTLFPPLSPQTLTLASARRIVLVAYNAERDTIDWRHFLISVKPYGVSRRVRRVLEAKKASASTAHQTGILDLGNEKDVADFVLRRRGSPGPDGDAGYESASSAASAVDDGEAAVSLADDYVGRGNSKGQRRAVRLDEIGPRMELRLVKIVEGVPGKEGGVIYHQFVKKSKKEVKELDAAHKERERIRKERRKEQERNVARKKAEAGKGGDDEDDDDEEMEDLDGDEAEDDEGHWDEEEEISEGEDSEDGAEESEESEEEPEQDKRPVKKVKFRGKG
ncbi:hypothetical protein PLICRDRAFT_111546 [Plicaturopsis crispa FD-325 SS-3]|nr:hypothetical protein PLICRDRAFT_111546 [Plicaturopsis crispa FD-325 SS-3]